MEFYLIILLAFFILSCLIILYGLKKIKSEYRIRIITKNNHEIRYEPQVKTKKWVNFETINQNGFINNEGNCATREEALERINKHLKLETDSKLQEIKTIEIEYITKL